MKFASSKGGESLPFIQASLRGYPEAGGVFIPSDEPDIRASVYAPSSGFEDTLSLSLAELLADELDPLSILDLASSCYSREPGHHPVDEDILVLDLGQGPSASSADYAASFSAALFSRILKPHDIVIAAAEGREASALAQAFASAARGLSLVLLKPAGAPSFRIPDGCRACSGGQTLIVEVDAGILECRELERRAALSGFGERRISPCGNMTPVWLLGRSLLLVGLFSMARHGLAGDLIVTAPPSDLLGLVTGLWAWSWGLPVSSFLVPRRPGEAGSGSIPGLPGGSGGSVESPGAEFLESFGREYPLASLIVGSEVDPATEMASRVLPDGLVLDKASAFALAAAKSALEAGLSGHARIVVPRFSDPSWDLPFPAATGSLPGFDARIAPSLEELFRALGPLL